VRSELRQRWIAALKSGKYTQGRDHLRNDNNTHCCLGVLCDITEGIQWQRGTIFYEAHYDNEKNNNYLPTKLARELGISNSGVFSITLELVKAAYLYGKEKLDHRLLARETDSLASLNDDHYTFDDIALVIQHAEFM
jgi:hypothetical protein